MNKHKLVKILLIVFVVTLFVLLIIRANYIKNNDKNAGVMEQYSAVKQALENLQCKYIKANDSTDDRFKTDYYAEIKYDLYENGKSQEMWYTTLIRSIAKANEYNSFRLIDDNKELLIAVICDSEERVIKQEYINGDINYFGNRASEISLENYEETKITNIILNSVELRELINKKWNEDINLGTKIDTFESYEIFNNGTEVKRVYGKVFNIVFNTNYKNSVVNGIIPGTSLEEIKLKLGEPDLCKNSRIYIGI